jgi:hypothetical protein
MQIRCENCRTSFDLPTQNNEESGACPYCEHVNHPTGTGRREADRLQSNHPSPSSAKKAGAAGKADYANRTMLFPPDAETKPDPDTALRQAMNGKTPSLPAGQPFELVIVEGDEIGKRFVMTTPKIVIGRGVQSDVQLKDVEVSREHCVIEAYGETLVIKDLRSANGTVLNGFLVRQDLLKPKDRIHIGNTTLELERHTNGSSKGNGTTHAKKH